MKVCKLCDTDESFYSRDEHDATAHRASLCQTNEDSLLIIQSLKSVSVISMFFNMSGVRMYLLNNFSIIYFTLFSSICY